MHLVWFSFGWIKKKGSVQKKFSLFMQDLVRTPQKTCLRLLTLTAMVQLTPNRKSYQLSKSELEFQLMEEIYAALCMYIWAEKMAEAYTTLVVLVSQIMSLTQVVPSVCLHHHSRKLECCYMTF